jgi:hypothetical protein
MTSTLSFLPLTLYFLRCNDLFALINHLSFWNFATIVIALLPIYDEEMIHSFCYESELGIWIKLRFFSMDDFACTRFFWWTSEIQFILHFYLNWFTDFEFSYMTCTFSFLRVYWFLHLFRNSAVRHVLEKSTPGAHSSPQIVLLGKFFSSIFFY